MRNLLVLLSLVAAAAFVPVELRAQDFTITIKNHRFTPSELKVPANKRIQLTVVNDDPTPEEFESKEMKVEKVIPGKSKGVVRFGPLDARPLSFLRRIQRSDRQRYGHRGIEHARRTDHRLS